MITKCKCGATLDSEKGEILKSYFDKQTNARITLCDKCAKEYGMTDTEKYYSVPYKEILESQKQYNVRTI